MIRKWTIYIVVCGFLAGLGLCLIVEHDDNHPGPEVPSTLFYTSQACGTSAVLSEDQFDSTRLLLASLLQTREDNLFKGVSLRPPFPPPRV